jgi:hypothetical protein
LTPKVGSGNRRDLLNDISQIYILLNGQTTDGRNATYASLFKSTRYAIILLAAITLENFKAQTVVFRGTPFYNLYRLEKVADYLRLAYDRTKQAKKIVFYETSVNIHYPGANIEHRTLRLLEYL